MKCRRHGIVYPFIGGDRDDLIVQRVWRLGRAIDAGLDAAVVPALNNLAPKALAVRRDLYECANSHQVPRKSGKSRENLQPLPVKPERKAKLARQ